jgi:hypothetical protein
LPPAGDDAGALTLHSDLEVVRLSAASGAVDVHTFHDGAKAEDRSLQIAAAQAWLGELAGLNS